MPPPPFRPRERLPTRLIPVVRVLFDALALGVGLAIATWIVGPAVGDARLLGAALLAQVLLIGVFEWAGLYRLEATVLHVEELESVVKMGFFAGVLSLAGIGLLPALQGTGPTVLLGWGVALVLLVVERRILVGVVDALRDQHAGNRRVLIYGCGEAGRLLMKKLLQSKDLHRTVVGFVDDYSRVGEEVSCRVDQYRRTTVSVRVLGRGNDLPGLLEELEIDELLVTTSAADMERVRALEESSQRCEIAFLPELGSVRADQLEVQDVGALPLLRPVQIRKSRAYAVSKRILDLGVAGLLLVLLAPVWLVIAVAIRLDSPGPVIFRQKRVGKGGALFTVYKFRSLRHDSDPYARSTSVSDRRATRVGRFLRHTGLDEIPQLLNVLKGDMSLVGPRPEMPFIVEDYTELERVRLTVKPGITGVWQLSPDREGAAIHENIEYDLYYIRKRTLLVDLLILAETAFFTVDVVIAAAQKVVRGAARLWHAEAEGEGRETRGDAPAGEASREVEGRLFLALDQRWSGGAPRSWGPAIEQAVETASASRLRLEILTTRRNVDEIHEILERCADARLERSGGVSYVPYEHPARVRHAVAQADLVLTDLGDLSELLRASRTPVVRLGTERPAPLGVEAPRPTLRAAP